MTPLLQLRDVRREYPSGEGVFTALKDINLEIHAGEYIAIVGASGSGKSTLMNIFGCLDRPTTGTYEVASRGTADMTSDDLAELRRELFGFIFQRYNLLSDLTALGNAEVPAIYAGEGRAQRHARAAAILSRLKLDDRKSHRPGQLSGGQQQRVSIARALMNGGEVILADEPTGALDSHVGEDVLAILKELHSQGHTIIIVTHDPKVAHHAERIIELRDGAIVSDVRTSSAGTSKPPTPVDFVRSLVSPRSYREKPVSGFLETSSGLLESLRMALLAMGAHRLRTILTMLGIIIGIASVVSVVALGNGSQEKVLQSISALGTNTLDIYPGAGYGDMRASRVQTLRATDALQLASQAFVDSATPRVSSSATVRYDSIAANAQVYGVGGDFFRVKGMRLIEGATFDTQAVLRLDQSVVIDDNARKELFGDARESPIGKIILLGRVPARIIGVVEQPGNVFGGTNLSVWAPYTTVMVRMLGQSYVTSISVRVSDHTPMHVAEEAITRLLSLQHGRKDFFIENTAKIRATIEATTKTMTLLIGSIAAISLLVGGIGVMNIMLVSVTERTREIGIRIAVGARQSDILRQFLIEAVLVCLIGGALGVLLALSLGVLFRHVGDDNFPMIFSGDSIVAAFACSTFIGIAFGFLPARNAARLDPIEALARE
jgi:macrolide transport system ATP-binding/permease protein